jgi:hypothetical protein
MPAVHDINHLGWNEDKMRAPRCKNIHVSHHANSRDKVWCERSLNSHFKRAREIALLVVLSGEITCVDWAPAKNYAAVEGRA